MGNNSTIEFYNKNAADFCEKHDSVRLDPFHKAVRANIKPGSRIIEIGCGSGRDAARSLADGYDIIALDGSEGLLKEIPKYHPELANRLVLGIMPCHLDFPDGYFDGFYSVACLMHLQQEDLTATLKELNRITKKGGKGLISIPTSRSDMRDGNIDAKGRVMNILPIATWEKYFNEAGFSCTHGEEEPDKLGREGIFWLTFIVEKSF